MPAGRPRQYETVEALSEIVDDYFDQLDNEVPSVTGLCLALNLTRQGLINYQGRDEFVDTIKIAKLRVEHAMEQALLRGSHAAGPIFNLKNNFGWVDEKKVDQNVTGELKVGNIERVITDP